MIDFIDVLGLIGMFALRVGVPLAVMAGLVYLFKRLDRRWEEEARLQRAAEQPAVRLGRPASVEVPAPSRRVPVPAPMIPFIPPPPPPMGQQLGLSPAELQQPCWEMWKCSESAKASCAAAQHPELPCWQARFEADGQIPDDCVHCKSFQRYPLM